MKTARLSLTLLGTLALATTAAAGPPLLCHPYDTGGAKSLPWDGGSGWNKAQASYDLSHLVADTLALLGPDVPVIARMETLRRAALYSTKDRAVAQALLDRLLARSKDGNALSLFDAGYLAETDKQAEWLFKLGNPAAGVDGYGLVVRAISARNDPAMEFAAALITSRPGTAVYQAHLEKARQAAQKDSLLAANLAGHSLR